MVRRGAARDPRPRVGAVEVLAALEQLQAHVDGGVDGGAALGLQVDAPVAGLGRQVRLERRDEAVELRRHPRRRVHGHALRRPLVAQVLHRALLEGEAVLEERGEVGAAERLRARAAEHAHLARARAVEGEVVLLEDRRQILAERVPPGEAADVVALVGHRGRDARPAHDGLGGWRVRGRVGGH